ncbi:hypothetical protein HVA01_20170 [Halovibrio variabilis]|uniref:Uncharacterized protein n=1 Tax=Halovibrio variabilis TaxID=31910 RepID=A0A511UQR3_9GAMM|nr:hypothetical protein HVA01_20170 [Halovibrio variabilis]
MTTTPPTAAASVVSTGQPNAPCQSGESSSAVSVSNATATCPEARSIITARHALPRNAAWLAWRCARPASPNTPPGKSWFTNSAR